MEVHQLRYVCAVAETGSFSRAAERCQVAQPSLSQQVMKIEEELGTKLFDRLGRGVRLSESGRAFLPHARAVLERLDLARASVASNNDGVSGSVTLGAIPTIAPYLVPGYTSSFTKQYPDARLRIVEDTTPVLIEGLRDLSIDFALLALPLRHKDLDLHPIRTEPLFAVLPRTHALAKSESLSLAELRGESFVMLRDGHCFRDLSLSICGSARVNPNIAFESGQFSSVLGMVGAGIGLSLVPEMAVEPTASCRFVLIRDSNAVRTIVLASLRGRNFNTVQQALATWMEPKAETRPNRRPSSGATERQSCETSAHP
ncbi:LysR family transcriptional regulator [Terriglobus roseus]|uniref:LysR family transcriptional regulator, hydrogen peroxide-inducible genes activator n=1 Tax=Terriglobus roseus TaxID=392734 RepID=A0A1H4PB02_9BACT|nr:LysR family transcriptional regulator [Terriglobus roseus]SEC04580.1 LysR family transcriptional regulator, hydrogen peroxide-inducible genes activator [Terriglobus roseus]